jgi:hypothetical protein
MTLYRPTKVDRGKGTYTESLADGRTIYGVIRVHDSQLTIITHRYTDIRMEDQIVADGAGYRVTGESHVLPAFYKQTPCERTDKPIVPNVADAGS